jgi:hypothetical protein
MKPNPPGSTAPDRKDGLIALGLGILSLALYIRTLVPGLLPGDSGEFQVLAYTMGHAHTTGYEVYTVLAKIFTLLVPVGEIAYRVNLFSAFCAGLTIVFVYLSGKTLSHSRLAGVIGAFVLAISSTFWSQAVIAEVYTAGSAITSAILWLVLSWYENGRSRYLFAAAILGGLGIGVHGSNILFAPAILLVILLKWKDLPKNWKPALGGAAAGVALFVLLFAFVDLQPTKSSSIRSIYQPSISRWDLQPGDLDSFGERFTYLVFARQWRSAMFHDAGDVFSRNLLIYGDFFGKDFPWMFQALILVSLVLFFWRRWQLGLFFLAALLTHFYYTLNYNIGDIYVFFISQYVYCAALVAEGVAILFDLINHLPGLAVKLLKPALFFLLLFLAAQPVYSQRLEALQAGELRFDFMGLPPNKQLEQQHKVILNNVRALDTNAIVLMDWTDLYRYYYAAEVQEKRNDVWFIEAYPRADKEGMADSLFPFLKEQMQLGCPVYALERYEDLQRGGFRLRMKAVGFTQMYQIEVR